VGHPMGEEGRTSADLEKTKGRERFVGVLINRGGEKVPEMVAPDRGGRRFQGFLKKKKGMSEKQNRHKKLCGKVVFLTVRHLKRGQQKT